MSDPSLSGQDLKKTPLYDAHVAAGARMVPFAGYHMPVQYKDGVLKEHLWTREHAGLFDVSHMGQARLRGENPAKSFEKLVSADYQGLKPGKQRYAVLLNAEGGVIDDLMTARPDDDGLFIVVNGACKDNDYRIIAEALKGEATVERLEDRALLALQGPEAAAVFQAHVSAELPAFIALLRKFSMPVVFTDHVEYPSIADVTGNFIYARLQKGQDTVPTAYPPKEINGWADRLTEWAKGGEPKDLNRVSAASKKGKPRDVFAYVIHEGKVRAPAAAMALIEQLK